MSLVSAGSAVEVVWLDSGMHMDYGWEDPKRYLQEASLDRMRVHTVGIVMHEDDEAVLVGLNHDEEHDRWLGVQLIARANIISIRRLV